MVDPIFGKLLRDFLDYLLVIDLGRYSIKKLDSQEFMSK